MNSPLIFQAQDNTSKKNNFEYTDFLLQTFWTEAVAVSANSISDQLFQLFLRWENDQSAGSSF